MRVPIGLLAFVAVLAIPAVAFADEIRVPKDFRKLQQAVDAAQPGDVILLEKGRHQGPIVVSTRDLTIEGRGGSVLGPRSRHGGGPGMQPAIHVRAWGFTARNLTFVRSGIHSVADRTTVAGCTFLRCDEKSAVPTAIEIRAGQATVVDNLVVGGKFSLEPIFVSGADAVIEGNALQGHRFYRGLVVSGNRARVRENTLSGFETRGGIEVIGEEALLEANDVGDLSGFGGGISVIGDRATVNDNDVDGTAIADPSIVVEGSDALIEGNDATSSAGTGIVARGTRNRILHNTVTGAVSLLSGVTTTTLGHGIVARGTANVLQGNFTVGTLADGIRIVGGTGNTVDGCTSNDASACGILNAGGETAVTGSTFLGNCIDVVNPGSFGTFDGNDFLTGSTDVTDFEGSLEPDQDFGLGATTFMGD